MPDTSGSRPSVAETLRIPLNPAADLAARNAVVTLLTEPSGDTLRQTMEWMYRIRRERGRVKETLEMAPWDPKETPATPKILAERMVAQAARTTEMLPVRDEPGIHEELAETHLFDHATPRAHPGPSIPLGGIEPISLKAALMGRVQVVFPEISSEEKIALAKAVEDLIHDHNNLLNPRAISLEPFLEPVLNEVRQEMGDDFIQTFDRHLAALEAKILLGVGKIGVQTGADGILQDKTGWRSEDLITAIENLMRDMVAGYDRFAKRELRPKKPDFQEGAIEKETGRYQAIKRIVVRMLAAKTEDSPPDTAKLELITQLKSIDIQPPSARGSIAIFVDNLKQRFKGELARGTAEELADFIVENIMTLELQTLLKRKKGKSDAVTAQEIAHKFYVLNWYFLVHLRNSLGSQALCPLQKDDQPGIDGVDSRMLDWNYKAPEVSDHNYRFEVVATLISLLSKSLRAIRISRYMRAAMGTL